MTWKLIQINSKYELINLFKITFAAFQDQAISVITDICSRSEPERGQSERHQACILMINILDKALFLEICVSRICAMGPSSARSDDFMREFKRLLEGKSSEMLLLSSLHQASSISLRTVH